MNPSMRSRSRQHEDEEEGHAQPEEYQANRNKSSSWSSSNTSSDNNTTNVTTTSSDNNTIDNRKSSSKRGYSYLALFQFASRYDLFLMAAGTLGAIGEGASVPLVCLVLSRLINSFGTGSTTGSTTGTSTAFHDVSTYCVYMLYVGLGGWAAAALEVGCWMTTGDRQSAALRLAYLRALLRQDMAFYDAPGAAAAATELLASGSATDTDAVAEAVGHKAGAVAAAAAQLVAAYAVAGYMCWPLALVGLALTPAVVGPAAAYARAAARAAREAARAAARADAAAEEAVGAVRTVQAEGVGAREGVVAGFREAVAEGAAVGVRQGKVKGVALAAGGVAYVVWALMVWVGRGLVERGDGVTGAEVVVVGFLIVSAAAAVGQAVPHFKVLADGAHAGGRMLALINSASAAAAEAVAAAAAGPGTAATAATAAAGMMSCSPLAVEFADVHFAYPCRPLAPVLRGFSLAVAPGATAALVGGSGCGKSTALALLVRLYAPQRGRVLLDGADAAERHRARVAWVSQEPAMLAASVRDNILFGWQADADADADADETQTQTQAAVEAAARAADAHGFVQGFPLGYATHVGERGVRLSGGQKQRIALARALLRRPGVLLLDEATSALDAQSERAVMDGLARLSSGGGGEGGRRTVTTLVVAHRLETVRGADAVAVVQAGRVVEMGAHDELVGIQGGVYAALYRLQQNEQQVQCVGDDDCEDDASGGDLHKTKKQQQADEEEEAKTDDDDDDADYNNCLDKDNHKVDDAQLHTPRQQQQQKKKKKRTAASPSGWWIWGHIATLAAPEWPHALLAFTAATTFGALHPIFAYLLGHLLDTFYRHTSSTSPTPPPTTSLRHDVGRVCVAFLGLAAISAATNLTQHHHLAITGDLAAARLRTAALARALSFPAAWYDSDSSSTTAAVCARIGGPAAAALRALLADRLSLAASTGAALAVAYALGTALSWRVALVLLALQPPVAACYAARRASLDAAASASARARVRAAEVAREAVRYARAVAAYGAHEDVVRRWSDGEGGMEGRRARRAVRRARGVAAGAVGGALALVYASWALALWYGAGLVRDGHVSFATFIKAYFTVVSTGRVVADALAVLVPDVARAARAARGVAELLRTPTEDDLDEQEQAAAAGTHGHKELVKAAGGGGGPTALAAAAATTRTTTPTTTTSTPPPDVRLRGVVFAYPSRPHTPVLRSLSLHIPAARTLALTGPSGCGKSTIIALLLRFYHPQRGRILLDHVDTRLIPARLLRARAALVPQDPAIFATTVRRNIALGSATHSDAEIEAAARAAHAHAFISALPQGYDTPVAAAGLSGGQRQRIAVARALLRDPGLLLLDEATSALDARAEAGVQAALDRAARGRTTVVVAHREAAVARAHVVAVLRRGRVVECGTHAELVARPGGAYAALFTPSASAGANDAAAAHSF